jgi:hypothetical protein
MAENEKGKITRIRAIPEPIEYRGKERLPAGWSTAAVGQWLIRKLGKSETLGDRYTSLSEIATFAYQRDNESNRDTVRRRSTILRKWLAARDHFLLIEYGGTPRRIMGMKICNPSSESDRQAAARKLFDLEAREEITHAERVRWEQLLYLPSEGGNDDASD